MTCIQTETGFRCTRTREELPPGHRLYCGFRFAETNHECAARGKGPCGELARGTPRKI